MTFSVGAKAIWMTATWPLLRRFWNVWGIESCTNTVGNVSYLLLTTTTSKPFWSWESWTFVIAEKNRIHNITKVLKTKHIAGDSLIVREWRRSRNSQIAEESWATPFQDLQTLACWWLSSCSNLNSPNSCCTSFWVCVWFPLQVDSSIGLGHCWLSAVWLWRYSWGHNHYHPQDRPHSWQQQSAGESQLLWPLW